MRYSIACIGRMKAGAEKDLFDRYLDRARKTGRNLGVTDVSVAESAESRASTPEQRKQDEAAVLVGQVPPGAKLVVLDENGRSLSSEAFARKLEDWKQDGVQDVVFAIGGADGHGPAMLSRADLKIAFGAMTWPHQLVRILLAEQVYRTLTIQAGHPYHRS